MQNRIFDIMLRECEAIRRNTMYLFSLIVFPVFVIVFFTTMMDAGQPQEMPMAVVDNDQTAITRSIIRRLDAMQTSDVVQHYATAGEARHAIQRGEIYAFLYIPEGTTEQLMAQRQPKISYYYSGTSLLAGALMFRDLKTVTTLANAAVGQQVLMAKGLTERQSMAVLQPVALDVHPLNNPWVNYNQYLSTMIIPACLLLFLMLLTAYTLGMELKLGTGAELMSRAGGDTVIALLGKLLPQTMVFSVLMWAHMFYLYGVLGFSHLGGVGWMLGLGVLSVVATQGFAVMIFALLPSMRLSMSICSLWSVLSFSMVGAAFPAFSMDAPLQALTWLFPMRHYWLIYSLNIFNGYSMAETWPNIAMLLLFASLPLFFLRKIKRVMNTYVYVA